MREIRLNGKMRPLIGVSSNYSTKERKALLSSRPEADIKEGLLDRFWPYVIELDEDRNRDDLKLFANDRVRRRFPRAAEETETINVQLSLQRALTVSYLALSGVRGLAEKL